MPNIEYLKKNTSSASCRSFEIDDKCSYKLGMTIILDIDRHFSHKAAETEQELTHSRTICKYLSYLTEYVQFFF